MHIPLGQKESAPRRCRRADGSLLGKSRERGRLSYWKLAFLFSRKACIPSFWSSVPKQVAKARAS